ncbi:MAG: uroporphyrinogen-III C-methyltransferase [Gammaproteobacteria bacterium]|nr:MAG: uroporphyrinogen-III C-methyltransferase [Gammaproteobacteria bacterium]RLA19652.1 MAG: uroporphyrinogen-III C-methyltransferase [Gammaproteobacteria bacterium]
MDFLPLFFNLKNSNCLVVGGGETASRKTALLLQAGANVTIISPKLGRSLQDLADNQKITHKNRTFEKGDVSGYKLIISATNDRQTNQQVSELANEHNIPVNVVDNPDLCSFIFPSIVDRSPVIAAISTGARSPVLARILRGKIESIIPAAFGRLAELSDKFRPAVKSRFSDIYQRRTFWEKVLQGPIAELVFAGHEEKAEAQLQALLKSDTSEPCCGEVYLVGGGPGDPDLLTFKALRLMQQADVVLYDRLIAPEVLNLVRRDAERIYVGKKRSHHHVAQDDINALLVKLAHEGKRVVRLKGGDPFIFGRGGEEIETLMEEGIPFQVVPGITAASGCAAYAGIPLTHRDHAQSCQFVTGNLKDGSVNLDWDSLALPNQTTVIYMGLTGLPQICNSLIEHGRSPDLAAALIQQGATRHQRVFTGTLKTLPELIKKEEIKPPTLIIIGSVISLQEKLTWFSSDQ